jgi:hypothetical protein
VGTPRDLIALGAIACAWGCADIRPHDPDDPGASGAADAAAGEPDQEATPPSVVPRPDAGATDTGGNAGADAGTAEQAGVRPTIRSTYTLDEEWVYIEWDIVEGVTEYSQFAVTDEGPFAYRLASGAADRGDFLYDYFHRDDICAAFAAGTAAGPHEVWVQIWPGEDSSLAESADTPGTITCP